MLSKSAKYATKAVLYLAANSNVDHKIMVKDMSKSINVPQAYVAKILQTLVKHDIVSSTRGPKGGFYLTEANKSQSILRIIEVIDGENKMTNCLLGIDKCNEAKPCPLHHIASSAKTELIHSFKNNSVGDLTNDTTFLD